MTAGSTPRRNAEASLDHDNGKKDPDPGILYRHTLSAAETRVRRRRLNVFLTSFGHSRKMLREGARPMVIFAHDFIGHHINIDGVFERMELDTLFGWLSSRHPEVFDGVAIDIGANIGNHTLYFSDHFRKVLAFEPNPRTFKVLSLNAELAANIACFEIGLSDVERRARMVASNGNVGGAHLVETRADGAREIALRTLDSLLAGGDLVRLIKVDVEGHEYEVLRGAADTIRRHQPIIVFEQLVSAFDEGVSPVIDLLREYGYHRFASISQRTRRLGSRVSTLHTLFRLLNRILIYKSRYLGTEWLIELQEKFPPRHYPMLVAIPDWVDLTLDIAAADSG